MIFLILTDIHFIFYHRIKERRSEKTFIYTLFCNIKISEYKILDRFFYTYYVNQYRKLESSDIAIQEPLFVFRFTDIFHKKNLFAIYWKLY